MVNLGFFREHRMSLPFPKKPLKLCPLHKMAERESSDVQRGLGSEGKRFSGWSGGGELYWAISYLRLKNLPQIRSRGPEIHPKTIPTTTFTTATSEKTTQNSGLITRQFTKSQAIIIR
jgi:hypothetical protein